MIISVLVCTRLLQFHRVPPCESKNHSPLWIHAEGPRIPTTGQQILIFAVISQRGELSTRADSHLKSLYTNREHFFIRRRFAHPLSSPGPNMGPCPIVSLVSFPRPVTHIPWITRENPFRPSTTSENARIILTDPRLSLHYPEDVWCRITFFARNVGDVAACLR